VRGKLISIFGEGRDAALLKFGDPFAWALTKDCGLYHIVPGDSGST
jgi:hypothetical protein